MKQEQVSNTHSKEKIPGPVLHKLAHATPTAEHVTLALATRQRIRDFSNLSSLEYELRHAGYKIVHDEYMQFWKDWQAAGLGMIVFGRNKKKTRFVHYYDMRKVAEAAMEGKDVEINVVDKSQKARLAAQHSGQLDSILTDIAKAPAKAARTVKAPSASRPATKQLKAPEAPRQAVNRVVISLRPGVIVDFSLPQDITPAEVDQLREAINRIAPAGAYSAA